LVVEPLRNPREHVFPHQCHWQSAPWASPFRAPHLPVCFFFFFSTCDFLLHFSFIFCDKNYLVHFPSVFFFSSDIFITAMFQRGALLNPDMREVIFQQMLTTELTIYKHYLHGMGEEMAIIANQTVTRMRNFQ